MSKKKIVIIGANDFQNQLILKAKEKGMETHVFAWKDGAVGEKTADYFYPISIIEKEQILKVCEEIQPDGVISIASDLAAITVNYVAEKLGLTGNGIESSLVATNKYLMRKAFAKNSDPSPKFYRSDELTNEIIEQLHLPVIVKPVDRSGSRGINKIEDKKELSMAIKAAEEVSFEHRAVIEEFVEGQEYSVEYISYRGKHTFLALTKKYTTGAPHFIETGHIEPAPIDNATLEKVQEIVTHALDTLQIKNGASHSEIKIKDDGEIKIIEIGGRMGGDCIGSDLVKISTGYDFVEMVIDVACGNEPRFEKVCIPAEAEIHFIFGENDMKALEEIKQKNPEMIYRISEIEPFDEHEVVDSSTRYGYYITRKE
ncbi:MAG: ATP-grasp domain-containing protein [Lachnospiraceae bacterium]|nr:ATP-grasp domain-containing protein [Lachnospiraceae bacterium]